MHPDDRCNRRYAHGHLVSIFGPATGEQGFRLIEATIASGDHVGVSAISLAEMVYLVEKGWIPPNALDDVLAAIADPKAVLQHVQLDDSVVLKMKEIPRRDVPDLPDRVIAATALFFEVPVLSGDGDIRSSAILTIW